MNYEIECPMCLARASAQYFAQTINWENVASVDCPNCGRYESDIKNVEPMLKNKTLREKVKKEFLRKKIKSEKPVRIFSKGYAAPGEFDGVSVKDVIEAVEPGNP